MESEKLRYPHGCIDGVTGKRVIFRTVSKERFLSTREKLFLKRGYKITHKGYRFFIAEHPLLPDYEVMVVFRELYKTAHSISCKGE